MSRKKNDPEENLTEKFDVRLTSKDMRNLENLAERECLNKTDLARRIILLYLRQELSN